MKRTYLLAGLVTILILALAPLAVLAQDDMEFEEYTSEDELLTLMYPADWVIEDAGDTIPFPAVMIANSEETMEKLASEENIPPDSGDIGIVAMLLPMEFLGLMQVEIAEDASPTELAESVVMALMEPDDEEGTETTEIGEVEELELSEDVMVGYITVTEEDSEGAFIVYELKDGIILVSFISTTPGEFEESLADLLAEVAVSIEFTGTAEDLMMGMMGGGVEPEDEPATSNLDGEALVNERCTTCHTADRIQNADKDEAGWTATVDRMIGYGAQLNDEERAALIEYLVATY